MTYKFRFKCTAGLPKAGKFGQRTKPNPGL